jgi:hypothetical protein
MGLGHIMNNTYYIRIHVSGNESGFSKPDIESERDSRFVCHLCITEKKKNNCKVYVKYLKRAMNRLFTVNKIITISEYFN